MSLDQNGHDPFGMTGFEIPNKDKIALALDLNFLEQGIFQLYFCLDVVSITESLLLFIEPSERLEFQSKFADDFLIQN